MLCTSFRTIRISRLFYAPSSDLVTTLFIRHSGSSNPRCSVAWDVAFALAISWSKIRGYAIACLHLARTETYQLALSLVQQFERPTTKFKEDPSTRALTTGKMASLWNERPAEHAQVDLNVRLSGLVVKNDDPTPLLRKFARMLRPGGWLQ